MSPDTVNIYNREAADVKLEFVEKMTEVQYRANRNGKKLVSVLYNEA